MTVFADCDLRMFIMRTARRHSCRKELREEYIQDAWLAISCAPGGWAIDSYKDVAYKAIHSGYWQNHKEDLLRRGWR